jgi:hypothetical protein
MFGKRNKKPRPPLPIDLRIIAAVNVIAGTVFLVVLALGIMILIAIMLLSLWSDRSGQAQASAFAELYVILLLEMALLILSGTQIYIQRLTRACITLGLFAAPGVYGLFKLPAAGMTSPAIAAIAIMLAYPLAILVYLAFRARTMRSVSGVVEPEAPAGPPTPPPPPDQTRNRP